MLKNNNYNFLSMLEEQDAFLHGHFCLPCGLHSEVYIKASALMKYAHIAKKVALLMSGKFQAQPDVVLSPSLNTYPIACAVAEVKNTRAVYSDGGALGRNFVIKPGESVLIVDDVAVSGKQIARAVLFVKSLGAKVIGVSVMVDRSSGELPIGAPLRALLSYPLVTYEERECPLCKRGVPLEKK